MVPTSPPLGSASHDGPAAPAVAAASSFAALLLDAISPAVTAVAAVAAVATTGRPNDPLTTPAAASGDERVDDRGATGAPEDEAGVSAADPGRTADGAAVSGGLVRGADHAAAWAGATPAQPRRPGGLATSQEAQPAEGPAAHAGTPASAGLPAAAAGSVVHDVEVPAAGLTPLPAASAPAAMATALGEETVRAPGQAVSAPGEPAPAATGPVDAGLPMDEPAPVMPAGSGTSRPAGEAAQVSQATQVVDAGTTVTPQAPSAAETGRPAAVAPSQLAQRVAEAVERLELAPPPRRMTVELGEMRLSVSLQGETVRVSVLSASAPAPADWSRDLEAALSARGLSLASETGAEGDAERHAGARNPGQDATNPKSGARRRPTSRPAAAGWRL